MRIEAGATGRESRSEEGEAAPRGGAPPLVQLARRLQARAGNRAAGRVLARVTYPHLRAVDPNYAGETVSASAVAGAVTPKLDALKAVYAAISGKPGSQIVTLANTSSVPGVQHVAGLAGLGGPYDPATRTARATVTEWHRLLNRWRDVLNDEYFSLPPGVSPANFPGRLPHNFNYTPRHEQWVRAQLAGQGVRRDSDAQRAASEVTVRNGKLIRAQTGREVDTGNSLTWFKGLGWEIFVLSHDGRLHMASHLVGRRHHSSLLGLHATAATGARDAASAGEMQVRNGKIVQLSTKTGHYLSGDQQLRQIVHMLAKQRADLSGTALLDFSGAQVAADARSWWQTTGQRAYEVGKTDFSVDWYRQQYGQPAINAALQAHGWNLDGTGRYWRKPDGNNANAREVRQALKAAFPRHYDPAATHGAANTPTALSL